MKISKDSSLRDPYRIVWTNEEVNHYFNEESVRWHSFEKTAEGYVVRYQGEILHPFKKTATWKDIMAVTLIVLVAIILFIPIVVIVIIAVPFMLLYSMTGGYYAGDRDTGIIPKK